MQRAVPQRDVRTTWGWIHTLVCSRCTPALLLILLCGNVLRMSGRVARGAPSGLGRGGSDPRATRAWFGRGAVRVITRSSPPPSWVAPLDSCGKAVLTPLIAADHRTRLRRPGTVDGQLADEGRNAGNRSARSLSRSPRSAQLRNGSTGLARRNPGSYPALRKPCARPSRLRRWALLVASFRFRGRGRTLCRPNGPACAETKKRSDPCPFRTSNVSNLVQYRAPIHTSLYAPAEEE